MSTIPKDVKVTWTGPIKGVSYVRAEVPITPERTHTINYSYHADYTSKEQMKEMLLERIDFVKDFLKSRPNTEIVYKVD